MECSPGLLELGPSFAQQPISSLRTLRDLPSAGCFTARWRTLLKPAAKVENGSIIIKSDPRRVGTSFGEPNYQRSSAMANRRALEKASPVAMVTITRPQKMKVCATAM